MKRLLLEQKPKTLALKTLRQAEAGRAKRRQSTVTAIRKLLYKARRRGPHMIYWQNN